MVEFEWLDGEGRYGKDSSELEVSVDDTMGNKEQLKICNPRGAKKCWEFSWQLMVTMRRKFNI